LVVQSVLLFIAYDEEGKALSMTEAESEDGVVKRGEIYLADLSPVVGSEQGGKRPVLIIQNDTGNKFSPTVIVAAITSARGKSDLPTHIPILAARSGLEKDSTILLEQIRTLDKSRLLQRIGYLSHDFMKSVDSAITVSLGFNRHV
jgi:mRNA interferase MazF